MTEIELTDEQKAWLAENQAEDKYREVWLFYRPGESFEEFKIEYDKWLDAIGNPGNEDFHSFKRWFTHRPSADDQR